MSTDTPEPIDPATEETSVAKKAPNKTAKKAAKKATKKVAKKASKKTAKAPKERFIRTCE